jgi:hypothetical protein
MPNSSEKLTSALFGDRVGDADDIDAAMIIAATLTVAGRWKWFLADRVKPSVPAQP